MKSVAIQSSALGGRWDAKYNILLAEHLELANELLAVLGADDLCALARSLPYDQLAAEAVCPPMNQGTFGKQRGQSYFFDWIGTPGQWKVDKNKAIAAYCAAAAQFAVAKILEEVLQLRKAEKAILDRLGVILESAKDKGAVKLVEAMKRSSK